MAASPSSRESKPWRKPQLVFAVVYAAVLLAVLATMRFSADAGAKQLIQQHKQAAPAPVEALPKPLVLRWPDIAVSTEAAAQANTESAETHFLARFREGDKPYLVARRTDGSLARFGIGDTVDGAAITRIGGGQVTLDAEGKSRNVAIKAKAK